MPVNFGNYVYRPATPLGVGGMGEGLDSIIQNNQEKARRAQQESQYARTRSDNQNLNAANFGRDEANTAFASTKGRYDQQMKAIADARAALQAGHTDVADAMVPTILALGGEARKNPDGTYYFKESAAPTRGGVDVGAARRQLYQGAPPGTGAGQPFQVPGFGAGGGRNPFEPQAVPGASAAALPPPPMQPMGGPQTANAGPPPGAAAPDSAGPPPGAARSVPPAGALWLPPGVDPGPQPAAPVAPEAPVAPTSAEADLAALNAAESEPELPPEGIPASSSAQAAQSGQPGSSQPTGPNPFQPPGLDPYTIDPQRVRQRNSERLEPFLGGVADAAGSRFKGRIEAINKYVNELGLPPAEAIKVTEKLYGEIFAQMRSEVTAEGQSGRLAQMGEHQQSIRDDKSRQFAVARINKLTDNDSLKATKQKLTAGREAQRLIPDAHRNGNSANALIETIYRMKNTGVMTDKDFERSSSGVQSLWGMIQKGTLNKLLHGGGGFSPTTVAELKELVDTSMASHDETMRIAASSLIRGYRTAPNPIEREEFGRAIVQFLPEEYLPEEFVEPWMERARNGQGASVPVIDEGDEQATMQRMAAEEGGVVDVTDGVPAGRHPTAPLPTKKQPAKKRIIDTVDANDMTDEQAEQAIRELEEDAAAEARKNKK